MAKSDLLKQAIADAKAVKETALANAKLALQEAFAPRLENVLQRRLQMEIDGADDELEADVEMGAEAGAEMGAEAGIGDYPDSVNVGLDFNDDGDYDLTGIIGGEEEIEAGAEADVEMGAEAGAEMGAEEDDLNLEEILEELEMGAEEDPMGTAPQLKPVGEGKYKYNEGEYANEEENEDLNIESIIEAILAEEDEPVKVIPSEEQPTTEAMDAMHDENQELKAEIAEAYRTVKQLQSVINEVNLLNAKLLYTNKLFRNFDLNEGQKMKVIENFDRAVSPREAKLVFATLAESFNKPTQKRKMVKESAASRPTRTTAPSQQTTQILSEGFEMANRWKKLAGLI
jgi:hypothetical protein